MRILHILNSPRGGATISATELVKESRAAETGVRHFAIYPGPPGFLDPGIHSTFHDARPIPLPGWQRPNWLGPMRNLVRAVLVARHTRFGQRTMRKLGEAIRDWQPDLVTTNCAVNIHGALAARRAGIPHVWHIRERVGSDGSMHFRLSDRRLVSRIADLSSAVAAVSEFVAEPFREYGVGDHLHVVYDGLDVASFGSSAARKGGQALRAKWGISGDDLLVGKVANVTALVKRHDLFLRAAAEVAQQDDRVRFVVVGEVPNGSGWFSRPSLDHWHSLKSLAHELGLDGRLVWAGLVSDPQAVMSAIDILAHGCDIEGYPRVVFEAMAAERPVVGPARGGVAEVVLDGATGLLVSPGSAKSLAQGIGRLLGNAELRGTLGYRGRKDVERRSRFSRHLDTMVNLYRKIAGDSSFPIKGGKLVDRPGPAGAKLR